MKKSTSWEEAVVGDYQKNLILPNLLRLMEINKGEIILDLGCGLGFFTREFAKKGAEVIGVDISQKLIEQASSLGKDKEKIKYYVASADNLPFVKNQSVDKATLILSIQNMENPDGVLKECARILKPNGKLFMVINHPAFRIPKTSEWGWDPERKIQYRRIDSYLSEAKEKIVMHPSTLRLASPKLQRGEQAHGKPEDYTITFHRPLQLYFKSLNKNGFYVSRLEEWISHRKSEPGPRAKAEDIARKEIPLFLFMEARVVK